MSLRIVLALCLALAAAWPAATAVAPAQARELSDADREHYKNAFLHFNKKRYRDARLHAARAENDLPAKVVRWLILTSQDHEADFDKARRFLEENPDWPRQSKLQATVERSMPWSLPDKEILAWYEARPPVSVDGAMKYVGALLRAKRLEQARALIRETWREGRFDRELEKNFYKRYRKALSREDHIARLDSLLWRRSTKTARRHARRIDKAHVALAEARILLGHGKPGVDGALKRVPARLRRDPGLLYDRASWRRRKGRYEGVVELIRPPNAELPRPRRWWPLRAWAAQEALERGSYGTAYQLARGNGLESGSRFAEAEWLAGWVAYRFQKKPKRAYRHFTRLFYGSTSPISQGRGGYWAGIAAQALGNEDWAQRWLKAAAKHSTSFYGQLAAARLGRAPEIAVDSSTLPDAEARKAYAQRELSRIVRLLGELGQRDYQQLFLLHLGDLAEGAEDYELAAELAKQVDRPDTALRIAKKARRKEVLLTHQLFPIPFTPEATEIEPALALAVMRQESLFDPRAKSPAGARGLMQLMPATAKKMSKKLRLKYSSRRLTRDPDYNVQLGTTYLAGLLERYDGNHILALAAYNAGPSRVRNWIHRHGDPRDPAIDAVNWIERIPFGETRNYVMRVLESLVVYRRRLNTGVVELPLGPATAEAGGAVQ